MASEFFNGEGGVRSPRTMAVVLCAPNEDAPRTLTDALKRRGVEPLVTHDVFAAALLTARASERGLPALIVVEPGAHRAGVLEDLLRSVRRRFPGVAIWRYDASARPALRAFSDVGEGTGSGSNGSGPVVVRNGAMRAQRSPSLRLTDEPLPAREMDEVGQDHAPSALLSEEELAMLLSDDLDSPRNSPRDNQSR